MEFFDIDYGPDETSQRNRLDAEWATLCALREIASIAKKGQIAVTYNQALSLGQVLIPSLYNPEQSLLLRQFESETTQEIRQKADALSKRASDSVDPLTVVEDLIKEYEELVTSTQDNDRLRKKLNQYYKAQEELKNTRSPEHNLIFDDVFRAQRDLPLSGDGRNYIDYVIDENRILRIRILHPNLPEHITGADVIYESYWEAQRLVRLAAMQYKVWENKTLYYDERMEKQIHKMHEVFCNNKLCEAFEKSQRVRAYRLPYCAAFLRPTDRLQNTSSRFVSTGYHIPICVVQNAWNKTTNGSKNISSSRMRSETVTHKVFEEMFNTNMLGSRYMKYEELEKLYHDHRVLEPTEHIIIHCQEYGR